MGYPICLVEIHGQDESFELSSGAPPYGNSLTSDLLEVKTDKSLSPERPAGAFEIRLARREDDDRGRTWMDKIRPQNVVVIQMMNHQGTIGAHGAGEMHTVMIGLVDTVTDTTGITSRGVPQRQVVDALPIDHALEVLLPALSGMLNGSSSNLLKVHVMEHRAGVYYGDLDLPRKGDWGLVVFPHGSDQYPVWIGSLYQDFNSLATANAHEKISQHDSGVWSKIDAAGNYEVAYPDGSYLRIGSGTALSPRTRQRRQGTMRQTVPYAMPAKASPTVFFRHSAGTTITIDPSGNLTIEGGSEVTVQSTQAGAHVHIGGAVSEDFMAKLGALTKIVSAFNAHTHGGVMAGGGVTAAPATQIVLAPVADYTQNAKAS